MKSLSTSKEFTNSFQRLQNKYSKYYWATAWASIDFDAYNILCNFSDRIEKMIVGIHFYQTHPNFIENFREHDNVKFVMKPEGVFHPKLFLFENDENNWECIIGSLNFTKSAFTRNSEVSILISSVNSDKNIFYQLHQLLDEYWNEGKKINNNEFEYYKNIWSRKQNLLKKISGHKLENSHNKAKPIFEVDVLNMSWKEYYDLISNDANLKIRIKLLNTCHGIYN